MTTLENVKIQLQIPRVVDEFWRSLGYGESNYQEIFIDGVRALVDAVESEAPRAREVLKLLEEAGRQC